MSRAIAHAIMARRSILGLQEQVMSEMNPLMTNTMSTHVRKRSPGRQSLTHFNRVATGPESQDEEVLSASTLAGTPGVADKDPIRRAESTEMQTPTHGWHYQRVNPLFDRQRPNTTFKARKSRDNRSLRTCSSVGLSC